MERVQEEDGREQVLVEEGGLKALPLIIAREFLCTLLNTFCTLYVMEVESILEDVPHHLLPGLLGVVHKHSTIHHQVKRVHAGQSLPQVVSIYCGSNPTS